MSSLRIALTAAVLNLINELFGRHQNAAHADSGVHVSAGIVGLDLPPQIVRSRAAVFFLWLAWLIALVALVGFVPAIGVFVFVYMWRGFGEPWANAAIASIATALTCWLVFDLVLNVHWPQSLLGDMLPALRTISGLI